VFVRKLGTNEYTTDNIKTRYPLVIRLLD